MGNFFNKFDPLREETWEEANCGCKKKAIFRCEITCDNFKDIKKVYEKYPNLEKYYYYYMSGFDNFIHYRFISCELCMDKQLKYLFTEIIHGWKEHIKCHEKWDSKNINEILKMNSNF